MADRYLLESGAPDGYLLEDGSGVLLLDEIVDTPLAVDSAAFDIDGQTIAGEAISLADPAQFEITGQAITLTVNAPIAVDSVAFDIDGQDVTLAVTANWTLAVSTAAIQPAGQDVTLAWVNNWSVAIDSAAFQIDGQSISLVAQGDTLFDVGSAAFSIIGQDIGFSLSNVTQEVTGGWALTAHDRKILRLRKKQREDELAEDEREQLADRLEAVMLADGSLTKTDADLIRLRGLVNQYQDIPNRARRAAIYAERAQTEMAIHLALREMQRLMEEEEYAVHTALMFD